jgi:hypothetical protein
MNRAINLAMSQDQVLAHCSASGISISALEGLPGGGVRLVCCSTAGADEVRDKLNGKVLSGDVKRASHRPSRPLW